VATSATVGYDLFEMVRIHRVTVWAQAALGTPTTVAIKYNTTTGDQTIHTDTSLGVKPAFVSARPSNKSLAAFFQLSGAGAAFQITAPAGSIIDVQCSFKTTSLAPVMAQNALVGATVGEFYYRGLDGLAAATTNLPPPMTVGIPII
jgi:hypothetical protein